MHKSPGADGFSAEYYKAFSAILAPELVKIFNIAASDGTFPKEMLQAIIITIPKPGKDVADPQNFRPISLLNSDLKIYAKILANRLMEITPSLIGLDQVGFVKGRQAPDGTRRMLDLLRISELSKQPSIFLALDAEKAFDRVHWGYLSRTLLKFGLSGMIHSAIMSLYSDPSARVFTSSLLSDPFALTNGTRQGCPLSPIIFSLVIEPLAESIRANDKIEGIKVGSVNHKIGLFADDIILSLSNPATSLPIVKTLLHKFGQISFYKVNTTKSYALSLYISNENKSRLENIFPCNWDPPSITYLGVQLTSSSSKIYSQNFPPLLTKIEEELHQITKLHLTWLGRIAAYQMQILPKLLYYFRSLPIPIPQKFFIQLEKCLKKYIWGGKKPRIALAHLYKPKHLGGVGLPNAQTYYKAAILDQMKYWFSCQTDNRRSDIERTVTPGHDLPALAIAACIHCRPNAPPYSTIRATIDAWSSIVHKHLTDTPIRKLNVPLASYEYLIPNFSVQPWKSSGDNFTTPAPPHQNAIDRYREYQLHHYKSKNPIRQIAIPQILWDFLLSKTSNKRKGISLFYKFTTPLYLHSKTPSMMKWEFELQKEFSMPQWHEAIKYNHKSSACVDHWDNAQKLLHRWYITPHRLNKMNPSITPLCWRNCQAIGNILHIFWNCTTIKPFWQKIQSLIRKVTSSDCTINPALALLSLGIENYPPLRRKVVTHILFAARIAIAKEWRSTSPPKIAEVISRVNAQYTMEKILAYTERRTPSFHKHWETWSSSKYASSHV